MATYIGKCIERNTKPTRRKRQEGTLVSTYRRHRMRSTATILAMTILAMHARTAVAAERSVAFDTDSETIGVDNRCSGCISHVKEDFVGPLKKTNKIVKGFGGSRVLNVKVGTLRWSWEDDQGQKHTFNIPNSFYIPEGKVRLLSPQHWAQGQNGKNRNRQNHCGEHTNSSECVLYWNNGNNKLHIPLGRRDNVATLQMAHGYEQFAVFCCEAGIDVQSSEIVAMPSGIISDDEDESDQEDALMPDQSSIERQWTPRENDTTVETTSQSTPITTEFNLNGPSMTASEGESTTASTSNVIIDEENRQPGSEMMQLLMAHYQYGHTPMRKLQTMAAQGILPKRLAKCRIPVCSACLYAKATRKPWRGKTRQNDDGDEKPSKPGQVVSVDQLVSPTPGLIAQMTGFLTTKRYRYATVYVDQYSRMGFVYLQKTASAEETVEGKLAFEAFAKRNGAQIENYHADNGIFKARLWTDACKKAGQGLTFAGVNAHHQNGIAERRIKEIQEMARTMLVHANSRWPDSVTANLWPYAVRTANDAINNTPCLQDGDKRTPAEIFSKSKVVSNPKHWKPFGCPVYVLNRSEERRGGKECW